jgi:hypothetical protein
MGLVTWRLPDSGQRCRRELGCDQMMHLFSLAMLLTLRGYILFRTSKYGPRFSQFQGQILCQHLMPIHLMLTSYVNLCQQGRLLDRRGRVRPSSQDCPHPCGQGIKIHLLHSHLTTLASSLGLNCQSVPLWFRRRPAVLLRTTGSMQD